MNSSQQELFSSRLPKHLLRSWCRKIKHSIAWEQSEHLGSLKGHIYSDQDDAINVQPSHLCCCRTLPWWGPFKADIAHVHSGDWAKASWFQWALDWTLAAKSCQTIQGQPQVSENGQHSSPLAYVSSENCLLVQADVKKVLDHWRRSSGKSRAWWVGSFNMYLEWQGSLRAVKSFIYYTFPQYLMIL